MLTQNKTDPVAVALVCVIALASVGSAQVNEYCVNGSSLGTLDDYSDASYTNLDRECTVFVNASMSFLSFSRSNFNGAAFEYSSLENVAFSNTSLEYAEFSEASSIVNAGFFHGNLTNMRFVNTTIDSSEFQRVLLVNGRFLNTWLNQVIFTDATLDHTVFGQGANIFNCTFIGYQMQHGHHHSAKVFESAFDFADMRKAHFENAQVVKNSFLGADLSETRWLNDTIVENCDFTNATLIDATFAGAVILESTFDGANCHGLIVEGGCEAFCETRNCWCDPVNTPTPSPTPTPQPACFSGDARVELECGQFVPLRDVEVGDSVRVRERTEAMLSGMREFEPVLLFVHQEHDVDGEFVELVLESGANLTISASHFVFTASRRLAPSDTVNAGDFLIGESGQHVAVVDSRRGVVRRGVYNPHTASGVIFVDGVRASCYTTALHPRVAHAILAPYRLAFTAAFLHAPLQQLRSMVQHGLPPSIALSGTHITGFMCSSTVHPPQRRLLKQARASF